MADAILYSASDKYEYIATPNQDGSRFRNKYHINLYGQRSDEPDSTKTIILGLGDSVIFGGTQSSQENIATSIFTNETDMQMLNISAGSWGPDNCAEYLKENGLFNASAIFLLVSSHDAHDNIDFQPVVDVHPNYPSQHYRLAWGELLDRYVKPKVISYFSNSQGGADPDQQVAQGIQKKGKVFNTGFDELKQMADSANIPLIVYLHAETSELQEGNYNKSGQLIINWADSVGVKLIKDLDLGFSVEDYRDIIHLSDSGQRKLANIMESEFGAVVR